MNSLFKTISDFYRKYSFHHILLAVFFVFYNANEFSGDVEFIEFVIPISILLALTLVSRFALAKYTGRSIQASVITTGILTPTLFYAYIFYFLISFAVLKSVLKEGYLIVVLIIALTILCLYVIKSKRELKSANLYLNILFSFYVFYEVVTLVRTPHIKDSTQRILDTKSDYTKKSFVEAPDIFLIITDAYANTENLKKYWGYDNKDFIKFLEEEKFYHVTYSSSNYDNTISSISSMLSMDFLPKHLDLSTTKKSIDIQNEIIEKIRMSKTFQKFRNEGYAIHNLSLFNILDIKQSFFDRFFYRNFYNYVLSKTLPMRILVRYTVMDHSSILDELKKITRSKDTAPTFVYSHLLLPHFPYAYDSAGNKRRSFSPSFQNPDRYLQQLIYTNKLMKSTVVDIRLNRPHAIIILASDHGYRLLENKSERQKEAYGNSLNIYYPDGDYNYLYDSMSLVNVFEAVFAKLEARKPNFKADKKGFFSN
jgi:hypothetical protein